MKEAFSREELQNVKLKRIIYIYLTPSSHRAVDCYVHLAAT
jgi:hypothetical protein